MANPLPSDSGSISVVLTGAFTSNQTVTVKYERQAGKTIQLLFPSVIAAAAGSGSTINGAAGQIPAWLSPATTTISQNCLVQSAGTNAQGSISITSTGAITIYNGVLTGNFGTTSNNGLPSAVNISYYSA